MLDRTKKKLNASQKLGQLVSEVRKQRGFTQTELAKRMQTSQSAINSIEKGKQNLSLDTIKRLSQALQQPFINLNDKKISLRIHGGRSLEGQVTIGTAKNTTLALMFAALLNYGKTVFKNAARVEEIFRIIEVFESIGVNIRWVGSDLEIKRPSHFDSANIDDEAAVQTRSVVMLIGVLAAEARKFAIPFSGGCRLGKRSITAHAYSLEELGIQINTTDDCYQITSRLTNSSRDIVMYESGDTATVNLLLAAARVDGTTVIKMASANYQVQDVCVFLTNLGIKIEGIGSTTLIVHGQSKAIKKDITYYPAEDPVIAMTLMSAAITTNSQIMIQRAPLDFLELELVKINKMNCKVEVIKQYLGHNGHLQLADILVHQHNGKMVALPDKISCRPYPGLNIDHLPYFVPIAASAEGTTLIHDWVYENRALYYTELSRIGAQVQLADPHRVYVQGPTEWRATDLACPPAIRPASVNLIGMLAAPGISTLRNVYTINRGYENLAHTFNELGAKIEIIQDI